MSAHVFVTVFLQMTKGCIGRVFLQRTWRLQLSFSTVL